MPVSRRTFATGLAAVASSVALETPALAAGMFPEDGVVPEELLSHEMQHDRSLWMGSLHEFAWAHRLAFHANGASAIRKVYPSAECEELRVFWNVVGWFFKNTERVLLSPPLNAHDLAFHFWVMNQFFSPKRLPDTSWTMVCFPEYYEQMERVAAPYGRSPDPVWAATYTGFLRAPDNIYLAYNAWWHGKKCSVPI